MGLLMTLSIYILIYVYNPGRLGLSQSVYYPQRWKQWFGKSSMKVDRILDIVNTEIQWKRMTNVIS